MAGMLMPAAAYVVRRFLLTIDPFVEVTESNDDESK